MAFALTAGLTKGAVHDALNAVKGGAVETLRLINYTDLKPNGTMTFHATDTNTITDLVLISGSKQAWKFEGFNRSLKPKYELVRGAFNVGYIHTIDFVVFEVSYDVKMELTKMAYSKVIAVVENIDKNVDLENPYEVYGLDAGLQVVTNVRDLNDGDSNGAFVISLATDPDGAKEGNMPYSWFDIDIAGTITNVEVLDTPTV
ncbi:hypothetical protein LCGC14_2553410 [marine sediment metagenome]|uniref:Uncharacterized protein n=1 Tax=marine sediment metagenome TaxID=412755 RepID=A0A0F9AM53_9ZZZZ